MSAYQPDWMQYASCREVGGDVWFPEPNDLNWVQARAVCRTCPTFHNCLEWVMSTELGKDYKYRHGIAAAMSPVERFKYEPQWLTERGAA